MLLCPLQFNYLLGVLLNNHAWFPFKIQYMRHALGVKNIYLLFTKLYLSMVGTRLQLCLSYAQITISATDQMKKLLCMSVHVVHDRIMKTKRLLPHTMSGNKRPEATKNDAVMPEPRRYFCIPTFFSLQSSCSKYVCEETHILYCAFCVMENSAIYIYGVM